MAQAATKIDPLANYMPVNLHDAYDDVIDCFKERIAPNLISSPGVGKSSLIHQIAKDKELLVVDVRLSMIDPTELNGYPHIWEVNGRKVASYIPMEMFPVVGKELPINPDTGKPYKGWILFLDEFNAATNVVQAAAYKVVLDRMIGMYDLDPRCVVAMAGNLLTDKAITNRLSTATQSRVTHLPIRVCNDTWHFWADANDVDYRITSFLKRFPHKLHDFDPNHTDLTFPCPRTWEHLSKLTKKYDPIPMKKLPMMAGTIGVGTAREYHAHSRVFKKIPEFPEIRRNPTGVQFDDDPAIEHALTGLVGYHMNKQNVGECLTFLSRLGADHQVVAIRQAVARDFELIQTPQMGEWLKTNTQELIRSR